MAFTGPYPTKFSGHTNAMVISATAFSGGVTNAGTIGPGGGGIITNSTFLTGGFVNTNLISGTANGISVLSDSTIAGAIVDSGTIRATKDDILVSGGVVSGGIQVGSHGTISAGSSAIVVTNTTTFAGGITNSGTISAGHSHDGIFVSNTSIFSGGIRNAASGRIAAGASGIEVKLVTTFAGGISNAGTISASDFSRVGIYLSKDAVFGSSSAGGGITNTGTISSGAGAGIDLFNVTTVFGSIVNKGKIIAGHGGIDVSTVTVFGSGSAGGGITNSGTISADHDGIYVNAATFLGGITNSGTISTAFTGIFLKTVTTFLGGITNSGTIISKTSAHGVDNASLFSGDIRNSSSGRIVAGSSGIEIKLVTTFTGGIINAGTITSTGRVGIFVDNASLFSGDISNSSSGRIAAGSTGIEVKLVTTFAGASVTRARFPRALTAFSSKTLRSSPATSSIAAPAELRPAPPASRSSWSLPSRATSAT